MKTMALLAALMTVASANQTQSAESVFKSFVTAQGDQMIEDGKAFRFISFNIPNLHLIEDNLVFDGGNAWRWTDSFEIKDALESIRQLGGTVTRSYVLSVVRTNDAPSVPRHVLGPGKFNEEGFRALDRVLQVANQTGVRVIVPLVDNWSWWGGRAEYAGFRGKSKNDFWTDPQVIADFKETIRFLIQRTNTLTGVEYRNDPAILCWETGNELESPVPWTREIAAFIKSLDRNHLVMDGFNTTVLRPESIAMPEVDLVTTHHYPGGKESFAGLVRANWAKAKGKKPYVVGEFGFVPTDQMVAMLEAVSETGASGALAWSLRTRNRDGGFYWHSEPAGGNKYKSFHWPGFASGDDYDETKFLAIMQRKALEIRGLSAPAASVPAPPTLLPIADAAAISWQGSVGATDYMVERALRESGPWQIAGNGVDETAVQYRPLFADTQAAAGQWYYRVSARNPAGLSRPSNVVGPVLVKHATLVDEMMDFSRVAERHGTLEIKSRDCRQAKEDAHRLAGQSGSVVVYHVAEPIQTVKLDAFFPTAVADFRLAVSEDGRNYASLSAERTVYDSGAGDYGYWKSARFQARVASSGARFLKVEFAAEAQIFRLEIAYGHAQ